MEDLEETAIRTELGKLHPDYDPNRLVEVLGTGYVDEIVDDSTAFICVTDSSGRRKYPVAELSKRGLDDGVNKFWAIVAYYRKEQLEVCLDMVRLNKPESQRES